MPFAFIVGGDWTLPEAPRLDPKLRALDLSRAGKCFQIDGTALDKLDTAGAWLLLRTKAQTWKRRARR